MLRRFLLLALVTLSIAACADYVNGPFHPRGGDDDDYTSDTTGGSNDTTGGGTDTTSGPTDTTVCFTRDILPILISNCTMAECHDAINPEEDVDLTSYTSIMQGRERIVRAGNPAESKLYRSLIETDRDEIMPPPPRSLTAEQIALVARWIREGARNRDCSNDNTGCDTANVTYTTHIQPIMQRSCNGCHSGTNPSAGINLTDRAVVTSMATSGRLYGSMAHSPGFVAMPPSGGKLDDCTLATIQAWKQQGLR